VLEGLLSNVETYVTTSPWLAFGAVFLGGLLTAASPCVLVMIPLMIGFVAGRREEGFTPWRAAAYSLVFIVGLSITFATQGVAAALAGRLYGDVSGVWRWIVAAVCLVMGLHLMGVLPFSIPTLNVRPRTRGALGALLLGLLFGVVSAPCAAPILIVLLTYLAGSGASIPYGAGLLLVYGLGHSVLIVVAGSSMGVARRLVESRRLARAAEWMRRGAGVVIILVGAYFAYQALTAG